MSSSMTKEALGANIWIRPGDEDDTNEEEELIFSSPQG